MSDTVKYPECFSGERRIVEEILVPVRQQWMCPQEGCDGEMKFNGYTWPTGNPGYHHTCTVCGVNLVVHGDKYPRVTYRPADV